MKLLSFIFVIKFIAQSKYLSFFCIPYQTQVFEVLVENGIDGLRTIKDACNAAGLNGKPVLLSVHGKCQKEIFQCVSALLCDGKHIDFYPKYSYPLSQTSLSLKPSNLSLGHLYQAFFPFSISNLFYIEQIILSLGSLRWTESIFSWTFCGKPLMFHSFYFITIGPLSK